MFLDTVFFAAITPLLPHFEDEYDLSKSGAGILAAAGIPTFVDSEHDSAHNKIMVIDAGSQQGIVITGSFNFTHAAQYRNAENLLIFRGNPQLTQSYLNNWKRHRAHSQTFEANRY